MRSQYSLPGLWGGQVFAALSLCLPAAVAIAQTGPAPPGTFAVVEVAGQSIAGRVVSAADGHPIPNASVMLSTQQLTGRGRRRDGAAPGQSQTVQTDAEGRYRMAAQPAGRYTLRASAPGYLPSLYLEHEGFSSAIVTGAGISTDDLRFALTPEASVHGRVLDETGEPVRATVTLYRDASDEVVSGLAGQGASQRIRPAGGTQADDDGRFDFTNLRPGRYYVTASATPWYAVHARPAQNEERLPYRTAIDPALDVAYPVTFYPHATTEAGATPIVLKAGQRAAANLLMQAERALTLTVQMPPEDTGPRSGIQPFPGLTHKVFGGEQASGSAVWGRIGDTVVLSGIARGQYDLRWFGRPGSPASDTVPIDLSAGSATVAMPAATAGGPAEVSIALQTAAGVALPDTVEAMLQRIGPQRDRAATAQGKVERGFARFSHVDAGTYEITLRLDGQPIHVSRLKANGKAAGSRVLRVNGDMKAEVTVSEHTPEVDGVVHAADGKVHVGSLAVLVPAGADTSEDLFRADQSDLDGGFRFLGVLPGNYLLIALDDAWKLNWRDPAALMPYLPHAQPVTVPDVARSIALPEAVVAQQR